MKLKQPKMFLDLKNKDHANVFNKVCSGEITELHPCPHGHDYESQQTCSHYEEQDESDFGECSTWLVRNTKCYCELQPINFYEGKRR